ncbi:hypothetical protein [Rhodococcus spelaei]|uniref:hypothetical protein n=1 Tax=Rhodococcus spelaei TaxID=2546320 RepID=UPI0015EF8580|nr:hypothetical protein [Rhodococcus spelaei]
MSTAIAAPTTSPSPTPVEVEESSTATSSTPSTTTTTTTPPPTSAASDPVLKESPAASATKQRTSTPPAVPSTAVETTSPSLTTTSSAEATSSSPAPAAAANGKKIPYTGKATENPNATVVPGKMRSDREEIPEGFTKADADKAETLEAKAKDPKNARSTFGILACQYFWPSPHAVCGAILDKYLSLGGSNSFLKHPINVELGNPDGVGRRQEFLVGPIYWHPTHGAHPVVNSFMTKWGSKGWEAGILGYPTTDEAVNPDGVGRRQNFVGGTIYWHPLAAPQAAFVGGAIRDKWGQTGWEGPGGLLGYPTEDEKVVGSNGAGRMNRFERGVIYWSPTTGAHPVSGIILAEWTESGYETGYYGYPTGDEFAMNPGRKQVFQNDYIDFGTAQSISKQHYDCSLNQSWPVATSSTNWVRSNIRATCTDPKQKIEMITQYFYTAPGQSNEVNLTEAVQVATGPQPLHEFKRGYTSTCVNGTYRARTKFNIINADGGTLPPPTPHRSDPVVVSNCRTVAPVCPATMSQPDCNASVDAYLFAVRKNMAARPGYAGKSVFDNDLNHLPTPVTKWLEYDVYLPDSNNDRTAERLVIDDGDRLGKIWFSKDHFKTQGGWTGWELE